MIYRANEDRKSGEELVLHWHVKYLISRLTRTSLANSPGCVGSTAETCCKKGRQNGQTYLNARANLAGRSAMKGTVKNATKKHTAAPIKHAPNPNSLRPHHGHSSQGL